MAEDTFYIRTRPSRDEYFLTMALTASMRGSCVRRKTGCVLVDKYNHIVGTGYNGRPRHFVECLQLPCEGSKAKSGMGLETCEAIHAEANALIQCKNTEEVRIAYCTTAPCIHCVKMLLNTGCNRIVFIEDYPHSGISAQLCHRVGVKWEHHIEPV